MELITSNFGTIVFILVIATLFYIFFYRKNLGTQPVDHFGAGPAVRWLFRRRGNFEREVGTMQRKFSHLLDQLKNEWKRSRRLQVLDEIWQRFNELYNQIREALKEIGLSIKELQDQRTAYQAKLAEAKTAKESYKTAEETGLLTDEKDQLYAVEAGRLVVLYEEALKRFDALILRLDEVFKVFQKIALKIEVGYSFWQEEKQVLATVHTLTQSLREAAYCWQDLDVSLFEPFKQIGAEIWADWSALERTLEDIARVKAEPVMVNQAPADHRNAVYERAEELAAQMRQQSAAPAA